MKKFNCEEFIGCIKEAKHINSNDLNTGWDNTPRELLLVSYHANSQ